MAENPVITQGRTALKIQLLGGFLVWRNGTQISEEKLQLRRVNSMIKLLALSPSHQLHRDQVIDYLWPDLDLSAAVNNFHQTLFVARRLLEPGGARCLALKDGLLVLSGGEGQNLIVDVEQFETAAQQAMNERAIDAYRAAISLYSGDLLPGDLYEEWTIQRREMLRKRYLGLLIDLASQYESIQAFPAAIDALLQVLKADPINDTAHTGLIRVYALSGQRQLALRQYQAMTEALQSDLDSEPDEQTTQLYKDIQSGRFPPPGPGQALNLSASDTSQSSIPRHNLPASLTPFLGREAEIDYLLNSLADSSIRLLSVIAPGGMGKTRLVLEAASRIAGHSPNLFADGIFFVSLAQFTEPESIITAIAEAVGFSPFPTQDEPRQQLLEFLKGRNLLLVLDNFEHLIGSFSVGLVLEILTSATGVWLLVTSRTRLNILGEQVVPLVGLDQPEMALPQSNAARSSSSVRLFESTARRANPVFTLADIRLPAVIEIIQLVHGMPLAIELAAAWTSILDPVQILAGIRNNLDFLEVDHSDLPERHRSLRAVFDASWRLLTEPERQAASRLAVFRGGFTVEAAESVADILLKTLLALANKCWIQPDGAGRFHSHEVTHQYFLERLAERGEQERMQRRHLAYYSGMAEDAYLRMWGQDQADWLRRLAGEHSNFSAAIEWVSRHPRLEEVEQVLRLVGSLYPYMGFSSHFVQGLQWAKTALSARNELPAPELLDPAVVGKALLPAGAFTFFQGLNEESAAYNQQALECCRSGGDPYGLSHALLHAGIFEMYIHHDTDTARAFFIEGMQVAQSVSCDWLISLHLGNIADLEFFLGNHEECYRISLELVETFRESGDRLSASFHMNAIGSQLVKWGRLSEAAEIARQGLVDFRAIGNRRHEAQALRILAMVAFGEGRPEESWSLSCQSLNIFWQIGARVDVADYLEQMALKMEDAQFAVMLLSAGQAAHHYFGSQSSLLREPASGTRLDWLKSELGQATFEQAWQKGQTISLSEAVHQAVSYINDHLSP